MTAPREFAGERIRVHLPAVFIAAAVFCAASLAQKKPDLMPIGELAPVKAQGTSPKPEGVAPHTFNLPFGANRFLPSQAEAQFSGFLAPSDFPTAEYCGKCHQAIYNQWRESVHANSFRAPFYTKNVNLLISEKGIEFSRHCEGCHNPVALFSGALTTGSAIQRDFDADGVTCSTCHSIARLKPETGLASYVMAKPAVLVDDAGNPVPGLPTAEEILSHRDWHKRAMMKDFYRTPEFCGACHKANLPTTLNGYKWLRAFSTYDEWQQSSWSRQSPAPFYKKPAVSTCQSCHMPRVAGADIAAAKDGTVVSHRWLGANTAIPAYYGYQEQLRQVTQYLQTDKLKIDIFALEESDASHRKENIPYAPVLRQISEDTGPDAMTAKAQQSPQKSAAQPFLNRIIAPIDSGDPKTQRQFSIAPGTSLTVDLVITNTGIGHSLVPEQRDFYQSWVEFSATDQLGRVVFHSGGIGSDGTVDPQAHSYTNRIISRQDDFLDKHQVWSAIARAYDNTILPGRSDLVRYRFVVPSDGGTLTISAKVHYRRFRRDFSDWVFGDKPTAPDRYPTVVMAEKKLTFHTGVNRAATILDKVEPNQTVNPAITVPVTAHTTALRWNNFGIALLDQQQFASAAEVFEYEAKLDPNMPDGPLNAGVARYMDGDYDQALRLLAAAERIEPGSPRARWYEGLCYRWQFRYELAIDKLAPLAASFPRFRQIHDELGYMYAKRHDFPAARREYETAQSIDPDDLAAHRWLATVYLKLGMKKEADREAALTSEENPDPVAGWEAQKYWQKHPEIAREIVPYHLHSNDPAETQRQAQTVNDLQNAPSLLWFLH